LRLTKRIANPGLDCRTQRGNSKGEIRTAKFENGALRLCGAALGWAILWVTRKSMSLKAVRLWLSGPAAEK
jgi:hypothetical protein